MKIKNQTLLAWCAAAATSLTAIRADAATTVGVDPGATWLGFMNVFERPANGGGFVFGSGWGTADLSAVYTGAILRLSPNTIGDPNPFWYVGGGGPGAAGNKTMDANFYVESNGPLSGQDVTFTGFVLDNTLTSAHTVVAFIKDFAPDYSSFTQTTTPLVDGIFSITHSTAAGSGRHVQYGFEMIGPNVWVTDVAPFGFVEVTAVPEPASLLLAGLGAAALLIVRRRR